MNYGCVRLASPNLNKSCSTLDELDLTVRAEAITEMALRANRRFSCHDQRLSFASPRISVTNAILMSLGLGAVVAALSWFTAAHSPDSMPVWAGMCLL